jgi:hypothetical protein
MQMSTFFAQQQQQQQKSNEIEDEEEIVEEEDDDDENNSLIIVDENHQQDDNDDKQKRISTNSRTQNNHLRCRQCDYEAEDLSDLLVHRKGHASMKYNQEFQQEKILSNNSDIENDDDDEDDKSRDIKFDEQMFDYGRLNKIFFLKNEIPFLILELHWLENNPLIKQLTTSKKKFYFYK